MPLLDKLTIKNPILVWLSRMGWVNPKVPFAERMHRMYLERENIYRESKGRPSDQATLTDAFLKSQDEHPEITDFEPFTHCTSIIGAASDAT